MTPALINHIVDSTATILGISREAICSSSRKRANVIARNIITDVAYNDFLFKYHEIGAVLKRNHSTLIKNKLSYEQDIIATPEIKYIRRQVLHNAQDFLLNLYGGYNSK
jgi:chromosomal replication initiation ATPase DnaA